MKKKNTHASSIRSSAAEYLTYVSAVGDVADSVEMRYDVSVAKNYLSKDEIAQLERLVSAYLDYAEFQTMRSIPMTMEDWETRLNGFLSFMDRDVQSKVMS